MDRAVKVESIPIYCINLPARVDRWRAMQTKLRGFNLIRHPATPHHRGWKGLICSNFFLLNRIIDNPHPLIVLEDDCLFLDPPNIFKNRLKRYIDFLEARRGEWDLFSGGGIYIRPIKVISTDPFIVECEWSVCTQFIIHSKKSAREIIRWAQNPHEWKHSIDTHLAISFKKIWLPYPMFCIQELGDSDIGKKKEYKDRIDDEFKKAQIVMDEFVKNNQANPKYSGG